MGEKETAATADAGSRVMFNPREYQRAGDPSLAPSAEAGEKSVQWEPHKSPGLEMPEQERATRTPEDAGDAALKTRHDTVKNSIGNIR